MSPTNGESFDPRKSAEIANWAATTSPDNAMIAFNVKRITAEEAVTRLRDTTAQGNLWAGEIAIAQASHEDQDTATWLSIASETLANAILYDLGGDRLQLIKTRAAVLHASLPAYASLFFEGRLPSKEIAKDIYYITMMAGYDLSQFSRDHYREFTPDDRHYMSGEHSLISTLVLAQREALKIGTEDWFPVPSLVTEAKNKNRRGSTINHDWDMSVHITRDSGPASLKYKVKVKSSRQQKWELQDDQKGIIRIDVAEDLGISKDGETEENVAIRIIEECYGEYLNPQNQTLAARLDQRGDQLLEKLDKD